EYCVQPQHGNTGIKLENRVVSRTVAVRRLSEAAEILAETKTLVVLSASPRCSSFEAEDVPNRMVHPGNRYLSTYCSLRDGNCAALLIQTAQSALSSKGVLRWDVMFADAAVEVSECQNYIRVLVKKKHNSLYVCGTNAFKPICRTYVQEPNGKYRKTHKDTAVKAICPFDPSHNTTAIYAEHQWRLLPPAPSVVALDVKIPRISVSAGEVCEAKLYIINGTDGFWQPAFAPDKSDGFCHSYAHGNLYSATVSDFSAQDSLIFESTHMLRTVQFDSKWLNEPNFVSSMEKDDLVYFFFRETAVENINCGKAVFSRVARVCKKDRGGNILLLNTFTSFFKARLNCSIPGDFPFYFDEIQSTTEMGKGNYRATFDSGDRSDMVYGVFNTPSNSIHGSAVCAFRYSDITKTFEGRFKGQKSFWHNWLTVPWDDTPQPHPSQCTNRSRELPDTTLNFIKKHPLMNNAVPASGGAPLLLHTSFQAQFTKIAVDWQVHAADDRYYDVMFVGTDDGRVIKAVNKGETAKIETVVIEDIRVFDSHDPVTDLKVYRDKAKGIEKLIVVSRESVVSIPLHRCHTRKTCRTCVELQDPYCAWNEGACLNAERGIQNVVEGWRSGWNNECEEVTIYGDPIMSRADVGVVVQNFCFFCGMAIISYRASACASLISNTAIPALIMHIYF
ncbi:hypothetical protein BaRGS_00016179, partial [Batillaria attramentaria]